MKKSVTFRTLASAVIMLLALLPFLFISSCQKEEQIIMDSDFLSANQLKSGTVSIAEIDELILKIEGYVTADDLEPGIANSLISKLSNAKKSLEKGNERAAANQLSSVQNQLEDLISEGTIDVTIGEGIILDIKEIQGEWICGQPFVDERDGNIYQTVKIGNQCWMAENLAYLPVVHPTSPALYTEPRYYVYGYEGTDVAAAKQQSNYTTYGVLYNWPAAMAGASSSSANPSGVQGICPNGWHIPSDAEWKQLEMAVGMSQSDADDIDNRGTNEGTKLKTTSGWDYDGNGTDDFGFSALPGGYRWGYDSFTNVGRAGYWWSSTEGSTSDGWCRYLYYGSTKVYRNYVSKGNGFSVRCVRDN